MTIALNDDTSEHIVAASEGYESLLKGEATVDTYLNLACLYWRVTDFGFVSHYHLSDAFYLRAGERCYEVLVQAREKFPQCPELIFWQRYFAWADRNESFTDEECLRIAMMPNSSLVPFFRLYSPSNNAFEKEARLLLVQCLEIPTMKNRYIVPILKKKLAEVKSVMKE